jgi:hypothetical protein
MTANPFSLWTIKLLIVLALDCTNVNIFSCRAGSAINYIRKNYFVHLWHATENANQSFFVSIIYRHEEIFGKQLVWFRQGQEYPH